MRQESADTTTWVLEPEQGRAPEYSPGQFNMLYLFGHGEVAISMSGNPRHDAANNQVTHTIREAGAVTRQIAKLEPGDVVGVRGPFGRGWPVAELEGRDVMIAAGGCGLAPLRSLVEWLLLYRERFGKIDLIYGARTPADILFADDLERWRAAPRVSVAITVDHPDAGWQGETGVVTGLIGEANTSSVTPGVVICGPEVMMHATREALLQRGFDDGAIWLSMERHMQCATGFCGHCLWGPKFVCRDGPVFRAADIAGLLAGVEL